MGRPRKPKALRDLEGVQPCRAARPADPGKAPFPDGPDHLEPVAAEAWRRLADVLGARGVLAATDAESVELYAVTYSIWRSAMDAIYLDGLEVAGKRGAISPHKLFAVVFACKRTMIRLLAQFGMTPASRGSVDAPEVDEDDPILRLIAPPDGKKTRVID